jgi:hypothetical protein
MPRKKQPDDKPLSIEQARGNIAEVVCDLLADNEPGPVTFRLKPTKKAEETYPLKLTPQQRDKPRWVYEYDFGDGWRHEVVFEGFVPVDPNKNYPQCVEGERACPPEDCGGLWGYADYLAAVREPAVEWTWEGTDGADMNEMTGRGWVKLKDGDLHGMIFIHLGDESGSWRSGRRRRNDR